MESADEVLPRWHVQGSLATNTAVDHGHGGRGHLAKLVPRCGQWGRIHIYNIIYIIYYILYILYIIYILYIYYIYMPQHAIEINRI